jgi:dihydroneopterin aldolase
VSRVYRIELRGLTARGHHGVLDAERRDGQSFIVDVALVVDTVPAAASDDLADTVDYAALSDGIVAIVTGKPVNLLETLASRIAERCLDDPRVVETTVTVHKPQAPIAHRFDDVAVTISRARQDR